LPFSDDQRIELQSVVDRHRAEPEHRSRQLSLL
jgi:hypothetical protein